MKYARIERERRFLLRELPPDLRHAPRWEIRDLYLEGTSLRLRHVLSELPQWKLTQKRPYGDDPALTQITNTYLTEAEYRLLATLPGSPLHKVRFAYPLGLAHAAVDVFRGDLAGLLLAEVEFESEEAMNGFATPAFFGQEVTGLHAFTGARLSVSRFEDLRPLLADALSRTYEEIMSAGP